MAIIQNRKAHHNYEILDKFEAGIVLFGYEVKAIRAAHMSLDGAYVLIDNIGKIQLVGANIKPLQPENVPATYVETRPRELLLKKKQIDELKLKTEQVGHTLIPLSVYNKEGLIKVEIALVKGKRKFDKRETLKKKDAQREIDRVFKR
ncbi:SsrA-binding protein SmpB [Candidatus Parcubacteria bacterium]|nr:SsrA-binding protein SmpB [Candidatus Parcubacteria bacterium]